MAKFTEVGNMQAVKYALGLSSPFCTRGKENQCMPSFHGEERSSLNRRLTFMSFK